MNKQRLQELAQHLLRGNLGHTEFNFLSYHTETQCGTTGCALGEMPYLRPDGWKMIDELPVLVSIKNLDHRELLVESCAMEWFDISIDEVNHLFYAHLQDPEYYGGYYLNGKATAKDVAENILMFIETMEAANE